MNTLNEDKIILDELKFLYKRFSPDIIEDFFYINNNDISKTIDLLVENINSLNIYDTKEQKEESKQNFEDNSTDEDDDDDCFFLLDENKKKK